MAHTYATHLIWTGNTGPGTSTYKSYGREYVVRIDGKAELHGSADPAFRGDASRHNPEDLLVASLSACHMLWYLHLCAVAKVVVVGYEDEATGTMLLDQDGGGRFTEVILRPRVTVADAGMIEPANALHAEAHAKCFIANSMNFPVKHEPAISVQPVAD